MTENNGYVTWRQASWVVGTCLTVLTIVLTLIEKRMTNHMDLPGHAVMVERSINFEKKMSDISDDLSVLKDNSASMKQKIGEFAVIQSRILKEVERR